MLAGDVWLSLESGCRRKHQQNRSKAWSKWEEGYNCCFMDWHFQELFSK